MKIINEIPPKVEQSTLVALDIEMFGQEQGKLHRPTGTFACLSIALEDGSVYQIYDEKQIPETLKNLRRGIWIFHNAVYDLRQLQRYCTKKIPELFVWDTMLVEQAMCGGLYQFFGLDDLVRRWLNKELDKSIRKKFESDTEMTAKMKKYAADDAVLTLKIAKMQKDKWLDDSGFSAYKDIDAPMIWTILGMPGIRVDVEGWEEMVTGFDKKAKTLEKKLGFNPKSTQQCQVALAESGLHLRSTGKEILEEHLDNPLVNKIIETRLYRDAVSKYGHKWIEEHVEKDGKVYSSWHITGAETGRMSSSDPNLQNIPQRKLPIYRTRFIPSPGNVMMVADVNQQEPRITAYMTKDEEYSNIFKKGGDSHLEVARTLFHEPKMKKDDPRRKNEGKMVNLGTSYGLSEYGLANKLHISEEEARKFLNAYFTRFRDVLLWTNNQRQFAAKHGYVVTASGRRVYINPYTYQWRNNAINAPIQGGAADFMKLWAVLFREQCQIHKIDFPLVALVHDEMVLDVPKEKVKTVKKLLEESMSVAAEQLFPGMPFKIDIEIGKSWGVKQIAEEAIEDEM